MDNESFRNHAKNLIDFICDYYNTVNSKSVHPEAAPEFLTSKLPPNPPQEGLEWEGVFQNFEKFFLPGLPKPQHFQYFGKPPIGGSCASLMADMLNNAFGNIYTDGTPNTPYKELENMMMDWLCIAMDLPMTYQNFSSGGGFLQSSDLEAVAKCMLAARNRRIKTHDKEDPRKFIVYCSALEKDSHHQKLESTTCMNVHELPWEGKNSIGVKMLNMTIDHDKEFGGIPIFLCVKITSKNGTIDDLEDIAKTCKEHGIWFHITLEEIGLSLICPELKTHTKGLETADSLSTSADVWGCVHQYCTCLWVNDKEVFTSAFITDKDKVVDQNPLQATTELQPFRSLNLWFTIQTHGLSGMRNYYRHHVESAKYVEKRLTENLDIEILNDVHYNVVCFQMRDYNEAVNRNLLKKLLDTNLIDLSEDTIDNKFALKLYITNADTKKEDLDTACDFIITYAHELKNLCTCMENTVE